DRAGRAGAGAGRAGRDRGAARLQPPGLARGGLATAAARGAGPRLARLPLGRPQPAPDARRHGRLRAPPDGRWLAAAPRSSVGPAPAAGSWSSPPGEAGTRWGWTPPRP